jgi:predicted amidohydrolase
LHAFINPHLSSGSEYLVFDLLGWKFGILICYDTHLPENVRITALKGAEIIMMPNVTCCLPGSDPGEGFVDRKLWDNRDKDPISIQREFLGPTGRVLLMKWLPTRAYENGVYIIFTNPIGIDDDQIRNGNAMVIDPNGNVIAETHKLGDDIVIGFCNRDLVNNAVGKIFLNARRPDIYGELTRPSETRPVTKVAWM